MVAEAAVKIDQPAKYINLNEMKTVPGEQNEYVQLELDYFKPFHVERVKRGVMNNWALYKPYMPYGEKFDSDYITLNGFDTWESITANNPPGLWQDVHGDIDFNTIHDKILSKRITVNNELWELVAFATK